jgi:DNA-binding NtrC family response regulator
MIGPKRQRDDRRKIFIIDDDTDITEAMQLLFETNGYAVQTFLTGKRGLQQALFDPPDIIVLDYFLPGEDTGTIIKQLQTNNKTKKIPMILISASLTAEKAAKEWKLSGFLEKPFHVNALLQLMEKCIINK